METKGGSLKKAYTDTHYQLWTGYENRKTEIENPAVVCSCDCVRKKIEIPVSWVTEV